MIVWIERFLMRLTDVVIAISESQRWELTEKYRIAPSYKITTKELGFNLEIFFNNESKRGNFRRNLGINDNRLLIGIIGRLVPIKNHKMFLEAAKYFVYKNPNLQVKFVIVGDGELRGPGAGWNGRLRQRRADERGGGDGGDGSRE